MMGMAGTIGTGRFWVIGPARGFGRGAGAVGRYGASTMSGGPPRDRVPPVLLAGLGRNRQVRLFGVDVLVALITLLVSCLVVSSARPGPHGGNHSPRRRGLRAVGAGRRAHRPAPA